MPDNGPKGSQQGPQSEMGGMGDMEQEMFPPMPPFMMMKMIFKLKEKVAKLEGMMKVMMHTQMGGNTQECMCECHH